MLAALTSFLIAASSPAASVLVVGRDADELQAALQAHRIPWEQTEQSHALEGKSGTHLQNESYPDPTLLTPSRLRSLEQFVSRGGRLFLEFATPEGGGELFGVQLSDNTRRATHQRLVVTGDLGPELAPGDILEEHNSACLVPGALPEGARVLLEYATVIGTYDVVKAGDAYEITVDLGEAQSITSVSQRYGAGQPNYLPESVELWLGEAPDALRQVARVDAPMEPGVRFDVEADARFVRLVSRKLKRGPVTDFFFMGEVEVTDGAGRNVALHRPYSLVPASGEGLYGDDGRKLTDGVVDGPYSDGLSVGWNTRDAEAWESWPALIEVPYGEGAVLLALTKLSDFRSREYRLTRRWEALMRFVALWLVPSEERDTAAARYIPLRCWTEPRAWAESDSTVMLHIETRVDAIVEATPAEGIALSPIAPGHWQAAFRPADGTHTIEAAARTAHGSASATIPLRVSSREEAYRRALDRNMQWFERSGVFPEADGSAGVWSQRCLAWFDGGPEWSLASPFRVDCNAATAQVCYLYGMLTKSDAWKQRGVNVARSMLPHQYTDASLPTYGGWPWLYEGVDAIYFWDDNTRIAVALLWLYTKTGGEEFLRAGLRTMELCADVAQADGTIARHVINAPQLDELGRRGFRRLPPQAVVVDFDLMRWAWAYGITGDADYRRLLESAIDTWGDMSAHRGIPFAVQHASRPELEGRMQALWDGFLELPNVKQHGVMLTGPGDAKYAYVNDCSINTEAGEPLVDLLYSTPALFQQALWAHHAARGGPYRQAFHAMGDFLVRTQFQSDDPRIDGAWMRGFEVAEWEVYGAPYDPNYGPYSAYTGWMNAFVSAALAQYLLGDSPLPSSRPDARAAEVLDEIRAEKPPTSRPTNIASGCRYTLTPEPTGAYADAGRELTDGVLDGPYVDGRSVGWAVPEGEELRVHVTLDLGQARTVAGISQRHGAGRKGYCPDSVEVNAGVDAQHLTPVAQVTQGGAGPGRRFIAFAQPTRAQFVQVTLTKRRANPTSDFLFVGEIDVFEEI